jgi:hypothetical protein
MVNYHDPDVILQDNCAYAFAAKYMGSGSQLILTVAVTNIWHAIAGLYLYVYPAGRSTLITIR